MKQQLQLIWGVKYMEKAQIGVVGGLGHIGLIQAACLAKLGYKTTGYVKIFPK